MIKTLLKIEWRKVFKNRIFWVMIALSFIALILAILGLQNIIERSNEQLKESALASIPLLPTNIFVFPHVWHNITFIARFLKLFLAVVMIILVTNEYAYNTLRQNLITGLSRKQLIGSKIIDVIILSIVSTIILLIFGLIMGFTNTTEIDFSEIIRKTNYLGAYFLMLIGFLSFAMMLAFIFKKPAFSIMILLVYSYILELIPAFKYSESFGDYLPLRNFNLLIEAPNIPAFQTFGISTFTNNIPTDHIIVGLFYLAVFWGISYFVIWKRDL